MNNKSGQTDGCVLKTHGEIEKRDDSMNLGNIDITQCFIGGASEIEERIQNKAEILAQLIGCNKAIN